MPDPDPEPYSEYSEYSLPETLPDFAEPERLDAGGLRSGWMAVEDLPPSSCSDPEPEAEWTDCSKRAEQHASAQGCTILSVEARSSAASCRAGTQGGCKAVAPAHLGLIGRRVVRISALIRASVTAAARALCAPGVARASVPGITNCAHQRGDGGAASGRCGGGARASSGRHSGATAARKWCTNSVRHSQR